MLLLDTHAFIWLASVRSHIPEKALGLIKDESDGLYVSSITATEIGLLANAGRIDTFGSLENFLFKNLRRFGIQEVPVDVEIALASTQLPPIHRDAFDRIIIATARKRDMTILTKDPVIPTYPNVKAVWE